MWLSRMTYSIGFGSSRGSWGVTSSWAVWDGDSELAVLIAQHRGNPSPTDQVITAAVHYIVGFRRGMVAGVAF
jgi:hypothetical protein